MVKIKIDFYQPIENENGDVIEVPKKDGEGKIIRDKDDNPETRDVVIAEHLVDFLEAGFSLVNSRAEFSALQTVTGKIETEETQYTERQVRIVLDTVDKVLENKDGSTGKAPVVMKGLFEFLDELEGRIEDD